MSILLTQKGFSYLEYDVAPNLSKSTYFDITDLLRIREIYPETEHKMHSHGVYCVVWFYTGEGVHHVDFNRYNIEKGVVFFLSPKHLHTFSQVKNISGVSITFTEDFLLRLDQDFIGKIKSKLFYPLDGIAYCKIPKSAKERLGHYVELMREAASEPENAPWRTCFFASALSLFLMDVDRFGKWKNSGEITTEGDLESYKLCQKFICLVEDNFTKIHAVKDYIAELGVSRPTLSNCTLQHIRKTPLKFINDRIVLEAKRMLRFSSLNVKGVAFTLGFEDVSYFIKMFRREVGKSPAEFKKQK